MSAEVAVEAASAWRPRVVAGGYTATASVGLEAITSREAAACTPFQRPFWLSTWYAALARGGDMRPLVIEVRTGAGDLALVLPLVLRTEGGLRAIEFADAGLTDYNLPLLGPACPTTPAAARAAWTAISAALPSADLCRFEKMPTTIDGRPNPLVEALRAHPNSLVGSYITIGDSHQEWLASLDRKHRKEMGRFWRVFTRTEGARFVRATTAADALRILDWIEASQRTRAQQLGLDYRLDRPDLQHFYRTLARDHTASGEVFLTALMAGDEIVAGLFAVGDGTKYTMLRIAAAGGDWANCSPGRLVIERSIHALHQDGYRWFDFAIGDYPYKRSFETTLIPLVDVVLARSVRGVPAASLAEAKAFVKRNPALERLARRGLAFARRRS